MRTLRHHRDPDPGPPCRSADWPLEGSATTSIAPLPGCCRQQPSEAYPGDSWGGFSQETRK